jgi:hypothetical protein
MAEEFGVFFSDVTPFCLVRIYEDLWTLISGYRRDVNEISGLLGYYMASYGNCLPTFRDNVSVPSSRVKSPSVKESL